MTSNSVEIDKVFTAAVDYVRALPPNQGQMDHGTQMSVYGLYKVAVFGEPPATCQKFGIAESLKFDAWHDAWISCLMDPVIAKQEYISLINTLRETFSR